MENKNELPSFVGQLLSKTASNSTQLLYVEKNSTPLWGFLRYSWEECSWRGILYFFDWKFWILAIMISWHFKNIHLLIIEFWLEEIIFILLHPSIIDKKMGISFTNEDKNENIHIFLFIFSNQLMHLIVLSYMRVIVSYFEKQGRFLYNWK